MNKPEIGQHAIYSEVELEPTRVRMTHPDLDTEIAVHPLAVPHHEYAGWEVVAGQDAEDEVERWPAEQQRFEGQQQVRLYHPDLEGDIIVAASAVPHHRSKGWLISDPEVADQFEGDQGLEAKTVEELKELAKERGISPLPTKKADLIAALNEEPTHEQDQDQPAEPAPADEEG